MSRITLSFLVLSFLAGPVAGSDDLSTTRQQYIATWKNEAIYQMVVHKIPASITLAQGILESGDGNSRLAKEGNNHFGIKCHNDWAGKTIIEDDETKGECFRKYNNARDSYEDHSTFLKRKRYEVLFKLDPDDYKGWARGLKQCGYATNPKYPDLLIGIIEEFKLHQYDELGLGFINKGKIPPRSADETAEPRVTAEETSKGAKEDRGKRKKTRHRDDDQAQRSEITISHNREIKRSENNIKYILVGPGENVASIANELEISQRLLLRYNDLQEGSKLTEGQLLYTQPKRNKARKESHIVKHGDSLWSISQQYGVKLRKLRELNPSADGQPLKSGQLLKLRK